MLILSACSNEEKASKAEAETKPKTEDKEEAKEDKEEKEDSEAESSASASGELNPAIAEETEGNVEVIFTNNDAKYTHDMNGFKVSVDGYEIAKVTDINDSMKVWFDDQTEGYVITAKVTIDNATDKKMWYSNYHRLQLTNDFDFIQSDGSSLIPEEQKINMIKKNQDDFTLYEPKEKVSGMVTFALTNEEFERMKTVKPKYIIEGGIADNDSFENSYLQNSQSFDFVYSDEQSQQVASQQEFYQDRLTSDNWADKKMIFEKSGINETQQIGDVKVTLDGVQYTEIIPTETNKEMFTDFGQNGITALTVKVNIDNQSSEAVSITNLGTILNIDDNRARYFSQGIAEPSQPLEIAAGQQGEKLHVFLFRKDEFDLYKKFTLEFGPFIGKDGNEAFKGKTATFNLPR
ncbi:DUF5068 domain-containing protein [Bacillus sp. ISL-41]|nr:DUF5068 domain-containing protein [Bacillus sp. ISL-41]